MAATSNGTTSNGSVNEGYKDDVTVEFQNGSKDKPPDYEAAVTMNGVTEDKDKEDKEDKDKKEKEEPPKVVGTAALFRFASCGDTLLCFLGILCSCANGVALPAMIIVFGDMIDSFVDNGAYQEKLKEIPWELTGYSMDEAMADPDIMKEVGRKLNMTEQFDAAADEMMDKLLDQIKTFAIYYCIIGAIVAVAAYGQVTCFLLSSYRQTQRIRMELFSAILRQDVGWYDTQEIGELNTRLTDDVAKIQEGMGDKIGNFFQWIAAFVAGLVIGFVYGWKLTLVIFAVSPLLAASGGFMAMLTTKAATAEQGAYAKAGAVAEEVIGAIRTVTAFAGQKKEVSRYAVNLNNAKTQGVKKALVNGGGMGLVFFIMFACYALAFWYGAELVREDGDNYTAGSMLIVFFAVLIGAFSLGNALPNVQTFSTARGAAYTIWQIIDRKPVIDSSSEEGISPATIEGNVSFENIHFSYPSRPDVKVLQGLSLQVKRGQIAALVGASGCGKSTTVQLLQRFYDPSEGTVMIDGQDIKTLNIKWLRQHIGVVSQEPVLFGTTIAENIRYGRDGVTQAEIEEAARMANAHSFITDMPKGYETLVGERGAQLSGGQKQRIAIARALVRDPKILLLDEATSALDTESEATVQEALDKASQGRTTLVIAHRLSTIKNADVIFGVRDGVACESGSHSQLMAQGGIYHQLVTNQKVHFEEGADFADVDLEGPASKAELTGQTSVLKRGISVDKSGDKPGKEDEQEDIPEVGMGRIMALNASEWYYILFGCVAAIGNGAIQPAFAVIFSEILGVFAIQDEKEKENQILFYSMMFLVIGLVAALSMFFQSLLFGLSGETLTLRLRSAAFRAYMRQEIAYFDDHRNNVGALCTRLSTDASAVQGATGARLGVACQSLASIGAGIIIGFIFSWKLTLVILLFLPAIGIGGFLQMKIMEGYSGAGLAALEGAGKIAVEAVENIRTVASLTKEEKFQDDYRGLTEPPYKNSMRKAHIYGLSFSFSQALIYFAYAAAFYFGAYLIKTDGLEFQNMFKVFSAIVFGAMAMGQASHFAPDYGKAKTSANRIFYLLDREPEIDALSEEGLDPGKPAEGSIRFENVEFFYPTRPTVPVLKGLSLEASRGETVALVGSSGCGKSTSVSLLLRFYDSAEGSVMLDGHHVNSVNISWLRQQMGIVQQEPILFDTSIRENIAYGDNARSDIPMDEILAAARKANIHDFISTLPDGYETNVGDKGTQLSGGQKQRVAIARALIRDPKILLLDEATSALDTESEKVVQAALDNAREGRTCVMIAHRLSTVQNANRIVVIHNGTVAEQGTHAELLAQNGLYTKLNNAQQRKEKL